MITFRHRRSLLGAFVTASLLVFATGCADECTRFIIISDIHPHETGFEQLEAMTGHVIELAPAFVFVLGDIGGDEVPGESEREIDAIGKSFNRMRSAGIEVFPVMGNHDVHPRVEDLKVAWFCSQTPMPLNQLFEASAASEAYRTFMAKGPYDYSFNRGGLHFAVVDSTCIPPRSGWSAERIEAERPRWQRHRQWMIDDFCRHRTNPRRLPTLAFIHHPEYVTGDRGMAARPMYRVLADGRAGHTVQAVFGGHWHNGQNLHGAEDIGVRVYATQISVHPSAACEFIVADVDKTGLTFHTRDSSTGQPNDSKVTYHPIAGRFGNLGE